jgi:hypothetical protein
MNFENAPAVLLLGVVYPLWVLAGFADWICHVRTDIAHTSGRKENRLHWVMFAEVGLGIAAAALLEINAALLLLLFVLFVLHEGTAYWDLAYSTLIRDVGPFEQMVHSFQELLPLLSIALLSTLSWPQALAVAHRGDDVPDWTLRWKAQPLPPEWLLIGLALALLFVVLPLMQETWACATAGRPRVRRASVGAGRVEPRLDPDPKARTPGTPGPR